MNSIYLAATVAMVAGLSAYAPVTESGQEQIPLLPLHCRSLQTALHSLAA